MIGSWCESELFTHISFIAQETPGEELAAPKPPERT